MIANTDILSLIQQKGNIALVGRPSRNFKNGIEHHSNCPFPSCGGHDRFAIWPDVGRYYCRVCGRSGDIIQFLKEFEDMTYREACDFLGVDSRYPEEWKKNDLPLFMTQDEEPNKKWQESAMDFALRAQRYLWTEKGKKTLEYLRGRGFTDDMIKQAMLGFCPGWFNSPLESWGIKPVQTEEEMLKIPEGVVIPWLVKNQIWKLSIRRDDGNYYQCLGSSDCLYNIDACTDGKSIILVESEFDALSIAQETTIIAAVATGGTSKGQTTQWITRLKQAPSVLIGFDADEAGNAGSATWQKKLPDALRWQPWAHDANDMLQKDLHIRMWVEQGLRALQTQIEVPLALEIHGSPIEVMPDVLCNSSVRTSAPLQRKPLDPWIKLNETGLPEFCTTARCRNRAIAWKSNISIMEAYCEKCIPQKFGW